MKPNSKKKVMLQSFLLTVISYQPLLLASEREFSGIGAVFLKPSQLMSKNSWSSTRLPKDQALENLLKYDAFWCAQAIAKNQPDVWKVLRSQYPEKIALFYVTPYTVRPNGTEAYLDYNYIEQHHPEWFLLSDARYDSIDDYKDADKRIRWISSPQSIYYNRFCLDVGNTDFQSWAVEQFLHKVNPVAGVHYSGITADNVQLTGWSRRITKQHPNWKYARSVSGWTQAYFSYLRKLHDALKKQGYILIVNHSTDYSSNRDGKEWQDLMVVVDGMADENALKVSVSNMQVFTKQQWEWSIKHHEQIINQGLYDWWICCPLKDDAKKGYEQFLYMYGSFLLTKKPGKSFFSLSGDIEGKNTVPWYHEYELPLGKPVGARYQLQGCWWRDYENAKIIVNPSRQIKNITLNSDHEWLDWADKNSSTRFVMEPVSSKILLPTVYPADGVHTD